MASPLVLVTGFGSFEEVDDNPSAGIARALAATPPPGLEVRSTVLPVSFERAPAAVDALLEELSPRVPDLLLGLGVDSKGTGYRLELHARGRLPGSERVDVDGVVAAACGSGGGALRTELDLSHLPAELQLAGAENVRLSENSGGYVCERIYHHLLTRARYLDRPALFVHVPPLEHEPLERQTRVVEAVIGRVVG